ncbi:threonine synthase, partial [Georgenia sp. 10Sc9-8]|nr:threonine synthase [Georgenia halotolerans]
EERTGAEVHIKVEGANPTGSFKDRGMTMAMSKVVAAGAEMVVCASTGNTSASAAAYAVRAGLGCAVILPAGKIAAGKLAQAIVHGATLVAVDGNFDDCLDIARALSGRYPVELVNSVNPFRLQGQKTAAFEVVDALGDAPDIHVLPVGNAGNISAYWMGYREYAHADGGLPAHASRTPQMWGVQAEGAAPFVKGAPVEHPETVATAIRIGNPASWALAEAARDESGGWIDAVSDAQILDAQALLAAEVGVFVEPASAASVAGLLQAAENGKVPAGARIVCTVTGNGLKDTATALGQARVDPPVIAPTVDDAARALGL